MLNAKGTGIENKIPNITNLDSKVALNTKLVEVENKIPQVFLLLLNSKYVWMQEKKKQPKLCK